MKQFLFLVCSIIVVATLVSGEMFLADEEVSDTIVGNNPAYNPTLGKTMVYASGVAYCSPADIRTWTCGAACGNLTGFNYYYTYQATIDTVLAFTVMTNDNTKQVVFTFRGTHSTLQLITEITNGKGAAYSTDKFNVAGAEVLAYFQNIYKKYFQSLVLSKLQALGKTNRSSYQYIFTGHSLGGALATLAALDGKTYGYIPVTSTSPILMTFGSPRVGNYIFATAAEALFPESYRVVHYNDLVPHVPPCPGQSPITFGCKKPSSLDSLTVDDTYWYGWHVTQEIFYNEDSSSWRACSQTNGEDDFCSDALPVDSVDAHMVYLGIPISGLCKNPTPGV